MKLLRIKDNALLKKSVFSDVAHLTGRLADKTLEQLEREGLFLFPALVRSAEDLTGGQMILQSVNDAYRTGNVMGFLGCGDERLIIQSRFCQEGSDHFFQYLLDRVLEFPSLVELETDAGQDSQLFNMLLFLFPLYLKTAMRKGPFKTYIRRRYNDANVKGTIDVARHIAGNTPFVGNVAYSQREYSCDNHLMQLVRHTAEFIRQKPYGRSLLVSAKDEVSLLAAATPGYEPCDRQKVIAENKQHPIGHAYYREYRALQHLCLLILQHQKHRIGAGSRRIYGVLFDGAWLWEEYIHTLVGDIFYHPMNRSGKGAQRLFAGNAGLIYPDFISRSRAPRVIADAKYKPVGNIGNRDYLQLLAYMFRFDARQGYFFYPEAGGGEALTLRMNSGTTYESDVAPREDVRVAKLGLHIPSGAGSYEAFKKDIRAAEQAFIQQLL